LAEKKTPQKISKATKDPLFILFSGGLCHINFNDTPKMLKMILRTGQSHRSGRSLELSVGQGYQTLKVNLRL